MFTDLKKFSLLFFALVAAQLVIEWFNLEYARYVLKPSFMILLFVYHVLNAKGDRSYFSRMMRVGFLFSLLGDVALMFDEKWPIFFIVGLGAFLIGHVGYALAFINSIRLAPGQVSTQSWLGSIIPFTLFSGVFFMMMKDDIVAQDPNLLIPVFAYTVVITLMGITASLRNGLTGTKDFTWILIGGVLFIISDVVIAVNKFMVDFAHDSVLNMSLYLTGQYFLAIGSLHYLEHRREA